MAAEITILDKRFRLLMTEESILAGVDAVAERINKELSGRQPLFLAVLNGAFMFAADLMKRITIPCEISFVKLASYEGLSSTGKVKEITGINEDIAGRTVVIVEDIIDSGQTMAQLLDSLARKNPKEVRVCSLFVKRDNIKTPVTIDYAAIEIGNDFIVGYGLDYNRQGRNLRDLYVAQE